MIEYNIGLRRFSNNSPTAPIKMRAAPFSFPSLSTAAVTKRAQPRIIGAGRMIEEIRSTSIKNLHSPEKLRGELQLRVSHVQ
jgi:hypothetical protein